MNQGKVAYLSLALAMIIVGTSVVVGKIISSSLPIFLSTFASLLIASLLFLPSLLKNKSFTNITRSDFFYLSLQALLGTVLYRIFLFLGLKYVDSSYAGILTALQPAMISLLAIVFLKEKQTWKQLLGVVLAVIGLFITYTSNSIKLELNSGLFIGSSLIFLSIFGGACFSIFAKKVSYKVKPFEIAGIVTIISTVLLTPLAIYDLFQSTFTSISLIQIASIIYYGVFLTYISFILWFRGLEKVKVGDAGIFTALVPIAGLFFSAIMLKDIPSFAEMISCVLITVSIILVVYKNRK